ncbi:DUF3179 domain-containing (seleno)protein [Pararhodobacter sp. CCB-MM2]|uniref:DUF3179 domain-containing (seleno)protein n=1 Tax=Pararhodobacter sp. CCB-MM2 TaxID=1786003 RepID=UPI0008295094|nr:DUF3179 domain-containing (seleno)protein [Pararhodobacter sp. CCB-MM2]
MLIVFSLLGVVALLNGTGAIWMALIEAVPLRWLRAHSFYRKPLAWALPALTLLWALLQPVFPLAVWGPLLVMALSVVLTYRMHQSVAFPAVDFPAHAEAEVLPLRDEMEIAVVEHNGVTRAYALDHLIHHHIINDRFGDRIVAVTYCAMCRSMIPFDVTEIGPLFVASFKGGNMIVGDRRTQTWFQQASFQSLMGPLHPRELEMVGYQMLSWRELRASDDVPPFAAFTEADLKEFELPIPGVWRKIMASEVTPGLSRAKHDTSLPARTHVIGVLERGLPPLAVERDAVRAAGVVPLAEIGVVLISGGGGVVGFHQDGRQLSLRDLHIVDAATGEQWTLRGKALAGQGDLRPVALSDEYWFSWKLFHPSARLLRP